MNRTQLLSTAAALLLLGAGAASAQAPAKDKDPAQPAPAAQQNAPAEKIAPPAKAGERKPGTSAQAPKAADPAQAQKAPTATPTTGAADASGKGDMKVPPAAAGKAEVKGAADTTKAVDSKTTTDTKSPDATKASETNKTAAPAATTGQGAGGAARLSTEQRSKITSVIRQQKVQPVTLNVSISVGTRVPSNVRYYPLPIEVVTYYPAWRGYDYILVGDQILVLDPRTHEIVAILDA